MGRNKEQTVQDNARLAQKQQQIKTWQWKFGQQKAAGEEDVAQIKRYEEDLQAAKAEVSALERHLNQTRENLVKQTAKTGVAQQSVAEEKAEKKEQKADYQHLVATEMQELNTSQQEVAEERADAEKEAVEIKQYDQDILAAEAHVSTLEQQLNQTLKKLAKQEEATAAATQNASGEAT